MPANPAIDIVFCCNISPVIVLPAPINIEMIKSMGSGLINDDRVVMNATTESTIHICDKTRSMGVRT